jgi:hypothetical protein
MCEVQRRQGAVNWANKSMYLFTILCSNVYLVADAFIFSFFSSSSSFFFFFFFFFFFGSTALVGLSPFFSSLIYTQSRRTAWTSDQPVARSLPTHTTTQTQTHTDILALSGIRTHDPSVQASEESVCLMPCGHCDRPIADTMKSKNYCN